MVIVANSLIVVTRLCKYSDRDAHIHTKMHMTLAVHQQSKLHSFNGLFSRTISVSQYQKGKSSLDLNEARDDGIWGGRGSISAVSTMKISTTTTLHLFSGLFPTRVSCCQKGKTRLDLNEARGDGVLGWSGISWTICRQSAP